MFTRTLCTAALAAGLAMPAAAGIDLKLIPDSPTVNACETVRVGVYAQWDGFDSYSTLSALTMIFSWDPANLQLVGIPDDAAGLLATAFMPLPTMDPWGVNDADPPVDGDAFFVGLATPGLPLDASTQVLLTELEFLALTATSSTPIGIVASAGTKPLILDTHVLDGVEPALDITGAFFPTAVEVIGVGDCEADPCPTDLNHDGVTDVADLVIVILAWGSDDASADLDGSGEVGIADLFALLVEWGVLCDA